MFLTDEFLETVFVIADKINSLDFSFDELSLLKSILIVRPGKTRQGKRIKYIEDKLKISKKQKKVSETSKIEESKNTKKI